MCQASFLILLLITAIPVMPMVIAIPAVTKDNSSYFSPVETISAEDDSAESFFRVPAAVTVTVAAFVDAADEDEEASAVGVTAIAEVGVAVGFDTGDTVGVTEGVDAEDLYTTATGEKVLMHPQAVVPLIIPSYSIILLLCRSARYTLFVF